VLSEGDGIAVRFHCGFIFKENRRLGAVTVWKADLFSRLIVAVLERDSEQKSQDCCWTEPGSKTEWAAGTAEALTETPSDPSPCL